MAEQFIDGSTANVATLGRVLRDEREHRLLGIDHVARLAGVQADTIRALERDEHELSPDELDTLIHHYQDHDWSTQRGLGALTLDLNKGIVSFSDKESSHVIDEAADRVLARYVLLLYRQKGVDVGTQISVKEIDLKVLRAALSVRKPEVQQQIQNLQRQAELNAAVIERRARLVVAGLTIVVVALGVAIVSVGSDAAPPEGVPDQVIVPNEVVVPPGAEITVEIGEAVSIVRPPTDTNDGPEG